MYTVSCNAGHEWVENVSSVSHLLLGFYNKIIKMMGPHYWFPVNYLVVIYFRDGHVCLVITLEESGEICWRFRKSCVVVLVLCLQFHAADCCHFYPGTLPHSSRVRAGRSSVSATSWTRQLENFSLEVHTPTNLENNKCKFQIISCQWFS